MKTLLIILIVGIFFMNCSLINTLEEMKLEFMKFNNELDFHSRRLTQIASKLYKKDEEDE